MTYSEISKRLLDLGYSKPKGNYTYNDRKYITFRRGTYSVTIYMDNDFKVLNLSFQHVNGTDYTYLITTSDIGKFKERVISDEEFLDIISRIDIKKMSKYPVDRMTGVMQNILNEKAIERL